MADGVRIEGTDELQRLANALKEAGDAELKKRVTAAMRNIGKPVARKVLDEGASKMPHGGGLSERVKSRGRIGMSNGIGGRSASVSLILRNPAVDLRSLDRGYVRHPVWGNRKTWVSQKVPSGAFTKAFDAEAVKVRAEVLKAMQNLLNDAARKA